MPSVRQVCAQEGPGPSRLSTKRGGQAEGSRVCEGRKDSPRAVGTAAQAPTVPRPVHGRSTRARVRSAAASDNFSCFPFLLGCSLISSRPHLKLYTLTAATLRVPFPWPALPVPCLLCPWQLRHTPLHPALAGPPRERRPEALPRALPTRRPTPLGHGPLPAGLRALRTGLSVIHCYVPTSRLGPGTQRTPGHGC